MKVYCVIALVLVHWSNGILGIDKLPEGYKRCKFGPDFESCMKTAITEALPKILTGYKELGLPSLEPFYIKSFKIDSNGDSPVSLKQELLNLVLPDFITNTVLVALKSDLNKREVEFVYEKPTLHLNGDYIMSGRVLVLPIEGRGKCSVKFTNMELRQKAKYEDVVKNGELYWHFTSVETKMIPQKMETNFENLFNGDKELSDSTNKVINENWQDIFTELEPHYSEAFSAISLRILNKFFSQIPVKKLFAE